MQQESKKNWMATGAYSTGYYLSYGVVFPTLFLVRIIPGAQTMISGFVDGALAARHYVTGLHESDAAQFQFTSESQTASSAAVRA